MKYSSGFLRFSFMMARDQCSRARWVALERLSKYEVERVFKDIPEGEFAVRVYQIRSRARIESACAVILYLLGVTVPWSLDPSIAWLFALGVGIPGTWLFSDSVRLESISKNPVYSIKQDIEVDANKDFWRLW